MHQFIFTYEPKVEKCCSIQYKKYSSDLYIHNQNDDIETDDLSIIGMTPVDIRSQPCPQAVEDGYSVLTAIPHGQIKAEPFVLGSRDRLENFMTYISSKWKRRPTVLGDWTRFANTAPESYSV